MKKLLINKQKIENIQNNKFDNINAFKSIVIIGAGLIGGSLALALRKSNIYKNCELNCICKNNSELNLLKTTKIFDNISTNISKAKFINDSDLLIFCAPISVIPKMINLISDKVKDDCIITDVGSIKKNIYIKLTKTSKSKYIGSHPMTGSEKSGFENADEYLFENAIVILTKPNINISDDFNKKLTRLNFFWQSLKCQVKTLTLDEHDAVVSNISHFPHLTAALIVNTAAQNKTIDNHSYIAFAGGGFKDTTRIASSNADLWTEICLFNRQAILKTCKAFKKEFEKVISYLKTQDAQALHNFFTAAQNNRKQIPVHLKGLLSIAFEIIINVKDEPGMLGKITT